MIYFCKYLSCLGEMTLASDGLHLVGVWFDGQAHYGQGVPLPWQEKEVPVLTQTKHWLDLYFSGENPDFLPPMAPRGTAFRQAVWKILLEIPYGQTMTYGQLAQKLGCRSAQAVGGAVGHNPISILIPCHRILGSGNQLTGYAGGLQRKKALLDWEQFAEK